MAGPLTPGTKMPMSPPDPVAQLSTFKSYVSLIADQSPNIIDRKLKAAQELSESFEQMIMFLPQYPQFLSDTVRVFLRVLQDGEAAFISEDNRQQLRKLLLEILHRIPATDHLKPFAPAILSLMFKLLEVENEENVIICLRIIIELHKQFRPQFTPEVSMFLRFVKDIYRKLPHFMQKVFEQRQQIRVKDLSELNIESLLEETFTVTAIITEKRNTENQAITYNLIPKGDQSLKVMAELPIIVVLMYQLYKQNVHSDVAEFIPLIMETITLQPSPPQGRPQAAFNRETFVDFIAAQVKTLSFLAYIIRIYQESITAHSAMMVRGMLGLLTLCPQEVAHLRKELLIAARHILSTDLRTKFVPCIEKLFDESVLVGGGWTTYDSLRPLAYSTLADLVHHIRQSLSLTDLSLAVNLFSKNVHDESLPSSIQNMSCKLLLNLVECIRAKSDVDNSNGRELFVRMLEVFVLKFKSIADTQIPFLLQKCNQSEGSKPPVTGSSGQSMSPTPTVVGSGSQGEGKEECKTPGIGGPPSSGALTLTLLNAMEKEDHRMSGGKLGSVCNLTQNYTVPDCRGLVKTLVSGVKTITWGIASCKTPTMDMSMVQNKQFLPKETLVYIRLLQYSLHALDIYTINVASISQAHTKSPAVQSVRTKEEKEVLEHLAGVYIMMSPVTFKEIFSTCIEYMVERIQHNYALQIVANSFLANVSTSATFATILVEYLLQHMDEMGSNVDRSNLYLKLFKLVFGSVSLLANENEQMLKPHLHTIVNKSMELARTAREPYNYFLLLRALFRSIGGGSHDLLYQEFLPLLPNLLQGLNSLQGGLHKQHMKDLFVELCLTVPVRLSSLLPYLPLLMDPLVSALNGSQTLISQGLRTLELCVDNLQPDFLFSHIQPVRAELMQALWRCLHGPTDVTAMIAYRVLGKFGGSNRKMLQEAQELKYCKREGVGPCLTVYFTDFKTPISLPVETSIDTALSMLKAGLPTGPMGVPAVSPTPAAGVGGQAGGCPEVQLRRDAWTLIKCFLFSSLSLDDELQLLQQSQLNLQFFSHQSFLERRPQLYQNCLYVCRDDHSRHVLQQALSAMFVAAAQKELRSEVVPFLTSLVCHMTLVAVSQQSGPCPLSQDRLIRNHGMDAHVLIDAIAVVMGNEEKDLCSHGNYAISLMLKMATLILGSKDKACELPMFEYLAEKMCELCYERSWYTKLGGCMVIKNLYDKMSLRWVLDHQLMFVKSFIFVIMDMTGEVSNGALEMAQANMTELIELCSRAVPTSSSVELTAARERSISSVVNELVRQVTSPNHCVREQVMGSLEAVARTVGKTVGEIIEPHRDTLADMVPPKKHLLRYQPANAQIGVMEGNAFFTSLEPRLFTIDLNIVEHKLFVTELQSLCETEDARLLRLPCYKNLTNLVPLRKAALKALAACHYIQEARQNIFSILYAFLNSETQELQLTAHDCMKRFISGFQIDMGLVHTAMRPLLFQLSDYSHLTVNRIQVLASLTQIFPNTFNEKLCLQLLTHLRKWLDAAVNLMRQGQVRVSGQVLSNEVKISVAIIEIFYLIPAASVKIMETLTAIILKGERELCVEAGSPLRAPLIKYLLRYPEATIDMFISEAKVLDQQWNRMLEWLLRQKDGGPLRAVLMNDPNKLMNLSTNVSVGSSAPDLEFLSILLINVLVECEPSWILEQRAVIMHLLNIWTSSSFLERHKKIDIVDYPQWQEPQLLLECLLSYFKSHPDEIELLFHMLRCFTERCIPQFQFFKEFLDNVVAETYSVEWKRRVFFQFVAIFHNQGWTQKLKAKILQCVLIPCFSNSFEKDEGDRLIGGSPMPDQENRDNIVSVFISDIIDPDNPFATSDAVRILLLQFSSLLVSQASPHIHDAANKKQGSKLRRLMTFAWPCLLPKTCVDPATKYHGHLLLSHIIAKFAIHKRIVLQVFHSLLKAHAVEARAVVRQALEILTPAMPGRMEDGNTMLTHWTKKIIVEEGHTVAQLVHILLLVVRHYKVYYPVRHHLIQNMITSLQKLGLTPNATLDHRKLAVDLAEVIIKWEAQRMREEGEETTGGLQVTTDPPQQQQQAGGGGVGGMISQAGGTVKRTTSVESPGSVEAKRARHSTDFLLQPSTSTGPPPLPGTSSSTSITTATGRAASDVNKPIDKHYCDTVVNFLLRLACQTTEVSGSPGDVLSRRCVTLLKKALSPDVWPNSDLKLFWFDKILMTVEGQQPNFTNICTALELLIFLFGILKNELILSSIKPLQRSIAACMTCPNSRVIRMVHSLLARLMSVFPTEPATSPVASKHEELECLYACVSKVVYEGLTNYDKVAGGGFPSQLFGTLMILKAACMYNPSYIDRLITSFMRVLQRIAREHLTPSTSELSNIVCELLILSLDLVKNRVGVMSPEMRKIFIGSILVALIEKSTDAKVMKAVMKMVEDWMKNKEPEVGTQPPSMREKVILLVRLMQQVEKRFPDDLDLNTQFLDLILYIYKEKALANSELTSKLEPAFLAGLRCSQPLLREKFFRVFDSSVRPRLYERLHYMMKVQNWEAMHTHYWIRQCIDLVLSVTSRDHHIHASNPAMLLPTPTKVLDTVDAQERAALLATSGLKEEGGAGGGEEELIDRELQMYMSQQADSSSSSSRAAVAAAAEFDDSSSADEMSHRDRVHCLRLRLEKQREFLVECKREITTSSYLNALTQLCHGSTQLSHDLWSRLLPLCWGILSDRHQADLSPLIGVFIVSGSHIVQKDCHPSALHSFYEAVSACNPPIPLRPSVIKYLGRTHNLWHKALLALEQMAFDNGLGTQLFRAQHSAAAAAAAQYDFDAGSSSSSLQQETLDSLCNMYELLGEEDMFVGVWLKRAKQPETHTALAYEQHGLYEQAQKVLEGATSRMRTEWANDTLSSADHPEMQLLEDQWVRCSTQLNQWDSLVEYSMSKGNHKAELLLDSSWRVVSPNWGEMKEALTKVEQNSSRELGWKLNLYRGYLSICNPDEPNVNIEKLVETSMSQVIKEWRRLPVVVSQVHVVLLQAAQQIMELQEASQINQSLQPPQLGRDQSLHDMKAIIKTWRNRLPTISDELSHWGDVFSWRQIHYNMVISQFEKFIPPTELNTINHAMLGVHHSAMATVHYGKIARKHGLTNLCLDTLSRIHSITSVPVVDCYHKIRQQVKCYLQMSGVMGKTELQEGLEVIESTNLKYFSKEMTSEFYALKGMFLAHIGRSEDANKAFSAAVQLYDTLVKAWALWGDYLEILFTRERHIYCGVGAVTAYLHACRHQNEGKSRKYLAKVLWLLSYDDERSQLAEALDKYNVGVPPAQWLPWIPQLMTCLIRNEGKLVLNLLSKIGSMYPQAVYFPLRTLYLTLKIEHRFRNTSTEASTAAAATATGTATTAAAATSSTAKTTAGLLTAGASSPAMVSSSRASTNQGLGDTAAAPASPSMSFMTADVNTGLIGPQLSLSESISQSQVSSATGSSISSSSSITVTTAMGSLPLTSPLSITIPPQPDLSSSLGPIRASPAMWRCSRVMHLQRDLHPTILASLEGIVDQMIWFRENWYEEVLRQLRQGLAKCYAVAFENRAAVTDTLVTPQTLSFMSRLVNTFGVGVEGVSSVPSSFSSSASESLAKRAQATAQDPIFQRMKSQFTADFDFNVAGSTKLHILINKLKKWIKILEARIKMLPRTYLIEEKCRFLSNFSLSTAEIELPGEFLLPKPNHYYVRVERFMPTVDIVHKHNTAARRLYIRGHNGKVYPYLVMNDGCMTESRREERVLQILRMSNHFLAKQMETSRRLLHFHVPRVIAVSPQMRLVEDNPSSLSLLDIYKQSTKRTTDLDAPILRYYERLATVQDRGSQPSHQVLRDVLKDVQSSQVPRSLLKDWALHCYPLATDYWTFRKLITIHLAVWGFAEFIFHLTRMNPEMMYVHQNSGFLDIAYFKFDMDDQTGDLNANRPVPFRLTPNIAEFLTPTGVTGPMTAAMVATARCFVYPQYKLPNFLSAILRDEYIMWFKKKQEDSNPGAQAADMEGDMLIQMVSKAVSAIMTRLQNLAMFEGAESRVSTLIAAANSPDNLCRMDPAWHPWL